MREVFAYALPLGSISLIFFLLWWEGRRQPPPAALLSLHLTPGTAAEALEGRVRLYLWTAYWQGCAPQVRLVDSGASTAVCQIALRLCRLYPAAVTYRRADLPTLEQVFADEVP